MKPTSYVLFLFGPKGVGKKTILAGLKQEIQSSAKVFEMTIPDLQQLEKELRERNTWNPDYYTDNTENRFNKMFNNLFNEMYYHYNGDPQKKNVVLINDEGGVFSNGTLNDKEISYIQRSMEQEKRKGTKFVIVESDPNFNPNQVLLDKDSMTSCIGVKPADEGDIVSILMYYAKRAETALTALKGLKKPEDVDSITYDILSRKSHEAIKEQIQNNTLSSLELGKQGSSIEQEFDEGDAYKLGELFSPNKTGAYSNADIKGFAIQAFNEFIQHPGISYYKTLVNIMLTEDDKNSKSRPISSGEYSSFQERYNSYTPEDKTNMLEILKRKALILGSLMDANDKEEYYSLQMKALADKYKGVGDIASSLEPQDEEIVSTLAKLQNVDPKKVLTTLQESI